MAVAHVNFFEEVGRSANTDVPVFDGSCSQDRLDIATIPAAGTTPPAVQATIEGGTKYAQIVSPDAKVKAYVGPAVTNAVANARAAVLAPGTNALSVLTDQVVQIWLY